MATTQNTKAPKNRKVMLSVQVTGRDQVQHFMLNEEGMSRFHRFMTWAACHDKQVAIIPVYLD